MWLIPGYRSDGVIGIGPGGPVHRVVPDRIGSEPLALRLVPIPTGPARAALRERAELTAALADAAIAVVHDVVDVDESTVAVLTTLGTGGSLADRLALGPLPVDEAVALVRTLCDALASIHELGITHGRIGATNVVLAPTGPLLTDAAVASASSPGSSPADDVEAVVHLAAGLVDPADRTPRATAYRSVCRWSIESGADLDGLMSALDRLMAATPAPAARTPSAPRAAAPRVSPVALPWRSQAALVVGASLAVGTLVGALGTLLPG